MGVGWCGGFAVLFSSKATGSHGQSEVGMGNLGIKLG